MCHRNIYLRRIVCLKSRIRKCNAESVFQVLIEMLEYKNSPNFHYLESDEDYDAEYVIELENKNIQL